MALSDTDVDPPPAHMLFAPSGDESARQPLPDGTVMVLDRDLRVVLAAGPGMAGGDATTAGLAGARLETLVHAVGRGVLADHVRSALDASTLALPGRDGEAPHQITIVPRRDATGDVTEVLLVSWEATGSAARTAAAQSERRYRLLTESATETVTLRDPDGTYCYVSPSSAALMGYRPEELVGRNAMELVHPTDAAHVARGIAGLLDGEDVVELEYRLRRRDGSWIWVQTTAIALRDPAGAALGEIRTSTRDITTRRAHEAELWAMTARLKLRLRETAAIAHLGAHALEQPDLDSFLADATRTVAEVFDVPLCAVLDEGDAGTGGPRMRAGVGWRDGVVGRSLPARPLQPGRRPSRLVDAATAVGELLPDRTWAPTLRAHGAVSGVWVLVGEREAPLAVLAVHACTPRVFSADERAFLVAVAKILRDAIVRRRAEDAARHDALHDALTGLPNRTLLTDRLAQALARARRSGSRHAVIFLDVDHFKLVNDSLGHAIGDRLLDAIGRRLRAAVRPADTVARFGGDEFVVLCEDLEYVQHAAHITQRLTDALRVPFDLGGREHVVTASAGLAVTDDTPRTADDVLDDADTAMYRAKAGGRARFELFDSSMRESTLARLELEDELRRAVTRDELVVAYQPIHHVDSDQPALVEALVRWQHPERGLLPPGAFIAIAEDSDLIVDVGAYVLRVACAQVAHWRATLAAARDLGLTINVAARQLARPDFVAEVTAILTATGMPAHALGLEITEGVLLADGGAAISTITALRDLGVRVLLDDFGTGYSSLSYLRRFPLDVLKIDRSFVTSLPESAEDRVVVEAIITMAHALGMDVTAEGVETPEQLQVLRQLGCGYAQGYLLARPMFADKLEELLHAAAA